MTIEKQIKALRELKDNYNEEGSPAPNPEAIDWLVWLLPLLPWFGLVPSSAEADAEGGAGFFFETPEGTEHRTAFLMQSNTGKRFLAFTHHENEGMGGVKELTPGNAIHLLESLFLFLKE